MKQELVFIPGLLSDEAFWQPTLEKLNVQHKTRIVDVSKLSSIEGAAGDLWKQVEGDAILVGFSLGAWVALAAYKLFPERCRGLVLISSAPGSLTEKTRRHFQQYIEQIESGQFEDFLAADFALDVADENQSNDALKERFFKMMRAQGPRIGISQLNAMLQFKGDFSNLRRVKCPTILVRGERDMSLNVKRQEQMREEIPMCELVVVSRAAHYVPIENPRDFAENLDGWLSASNQPSVLNK